jgi:hypothetical protein
MLLPPVTERKREHCINILPHRHAVQTCSPHATDWLRLKNDITAKKPSENSGDSYQIRICLHSWTQNFSHFRKSLMNSIW